MPRVEENKNRMVTLRVSEEDYELLKVCACVSGQTRPNGDPNLGEYIRFMLRMSLVPMKTELRKRGVTPSEAYEHVRSGDGLLQHESLSL